jgi:recombination protein RecA
MSADRKKALEAALASITKQFGKGAIMKLGETPNMSVEVFSSGSIALDIALGAGGFPRGRIIEVYGERIAI